MTKADISPSPITVRLSDVAPQEVDWLWLARFPSGKLSMIVGDPGLGKSLVTLDIAARLSKGTPWPDQPYEPQCAADVLILSAEDDIADTLRPRLDAMGADCSRIHVLKAIREHVRGDEIYRGFNLSGDIERLRAVLDENPHIKLIIIDPISAYLGRIDSHNNAEVRDALAPLCALAAEKGVAIICVTHLNKGAGSPTYRVMGSVAFTAVVRASWLVAKDPDDPENRLLLSVKNNLAPDYATVGLSFTIESRGLYGAPVVCWSDAPVTATAADVLAVEPTKRGRPAESRRAAADWLRAALADGPRAVAWLQADAKANRIAWRTVQRAMDEIGVVSFQPKIPGPHYWKLPDATGELPTFGESRAA